MDRWQCCRHDWLLLFYLALPTCCCCLLNTRNVQVVAILAAGRELPFTVQPAKLELPELQGEPEDISREKCRIAAAQLGAAVMVEDTSLCFNALKGLPGVDWGGGPTQNMISLVCSLYTQQLSFTAA